LTVPVIRSDILFASLWQMKKDVSGTCFVPSEQSNKMAHG